MTPTNTARSLIVILLCGLSITSQAGNAGGSAQQFVQIFYNWYVPFSNKQHDSLACDEAMNAHPEYFSEDLYRLLKKDTTKQETHSGLQGIGFDPFMNSQDPAPKYVVGNVHNDGDHYLIDVYAVYEHGRREMALTARVKVQNGHCGFHRLSLPGGAKSKTAASCLALETLGCA